MNPLSVLLTKRKNMVDLYHEIQTITPSPKTFTTFKFVFIALSGEHLTSFKPLIFCVWWTLLHVSRVRLHNMIIKWSQTFSCEKNLMRNSYHCSFTEKHLVAMVIFCRSFLCKIELFLLSERHCTLSKDLCNVHTHTHRHLKCHISLAKCANCCQHSLTQTKPALITAPV